MLYFQENFVEKNTEIVSTEIFDIIKKSFDQLTDKLSDKINSKSVTNCLRNDLGKLMQELNEMDSHFIRCIKPNNGRKSNCFDDEIVKSQLKANCIVPYINLMKKGYPDRMSYTQLLPEFEEYLPSDVIENPRKLSEYLLIVIGYESQDYKLAETNIFFRPEKINLFHQYNMLDKTVIMDLALKIHNHMKIESQLQEANKSKQL